MKIQKREQLKKQFKQIIKRLKEIIHILDFKQILDIFIFPIFFILSIIAKPFCSKIWIIAENPNEACDNGYSLFKYIRKNRKDINAYYIINKKSKDFEKIKEFNNIIQYRSIKHWIYYLNAEKIIATQKYANPSPAIFYFLHTRNILKIPRIYLKHGITKDESKLLYYNRTKFKLFICGAKREYEYIKNNYGYPQGNVVYTGFARFDDLNIDTDIDIDTDTNTNTDTNTETNKENNKTRDTIKTKNPKIILIFPTWRKWIYKQKQFDEFIKNYYNIIENQNLLDYLEKNNVKIKFIQHKNMRKFKLNYNNNKLNNNIEVKHNDEVDIQKIINETELLITDFSSIFFDIAYRKRPIIYYQFDTEEYRNKQLQEGYFSYQRDGFGEVISNPENVINKIKFYIDNNFCVEDLYSKRMDDFFERKDKNNCKRIIEQIEKIK